MPSLIQLEWLNHRSLIKPFNGIMRLLESLRGTRLDEEQWEHMRWNWFSATMAAPLRWGVRETQWGSGSSGESILRSIWDLALGRAPNSRWEQARRSNKLSARSTEKTIFERLYKVKVLIRVRAEGGKWVTCIWSQLLLHHVQAIVWPGNQW